MSEHNIMFVQNTMILWLYSFASGKFTERIFFQCKGHEYVVQIVEFIFLNISAHIKVGYTTSLTVEANWTIPYFLWVTELILMVKGIGF